jgi:acyl carrier protein
MKKSELRSLVAEVFECPPADITSDGDLRALPGFDSVSVLSLMIVLDERAGIKLGPEDAAGLRCFREIETLAARQGVELTE